MARSYRTRLTPDELDEKMQRLVGIMMMNHVGKDNLISMEELELKLGSYQKSDRNSAMTRREIMKLMEQSPIPIGATNRGVYILSTDAELKEYMSTLEKRAEAILGRMETVTRAYKSMRKVN